MRVRQSDGRFPIFLNFALVVGLLVSSCSVQAGQPKAPLQALTMKDTIARLEREVPRLLADGDVPGLSIALIRDGELAWVHGFGVRNATTKEPVTNDTVFDAASLSKPVFAYAVLKLADAGKLDLDIPLTKYLPGTYDVGDDARLRSITARHVLTHTTGFPNWRPRQGDTRLKIHFAPGSQFSYSGEGFVYLAKVVEHLTGEKLEAFMKRTVFDPLGMTSSSYVWQDRYAALKAFDHDAFGTPTEQNKATEANSAASLSTTARDYGRFVVAVLAGTGLKKETARLMLTPRVRVGASTNSIDKPLGELSTSVAWGLGWGLQSTADGTSFWHWGDNGENKAFVMAFDERKSGVAVFTDGANGLSIMREIVEMSLGGSHPSLDWLDYESYKSPGRVLVKGIREKGAARALAEYREWRKGRASGDLVTEAKMNQLGYNLLYGLHRAEDAIEVFKQNVADYPKSYNAYDSLGEAYMVGGDTEQAIRNYRRSVDLKPDHTHGKEMLKKLGAEQ
jgi:CubicO group peptidase (beta-lactamase class C family)